MHVPSRDFTPPVRAGIFIGLVVSLWFALITLPKAPHAELDPSWGQVIIHAHARDWQFGRDIIFTYGPWGFLTASHHLGGESAAARVIWEYCGKLAIAVGLVILTADLRMGRRWAFVLAIVILHPLAPPWISFDVTCFVFVALAVVRLGREPPASLPLYLIIGLAFGFLAQIKFTYAVLSLLGIGSTVALGLFERRWAKVFALSGGYASAFVVAWVMAGQSLVHLGEYFRASTEILAGYVAMATAEGAGLAVLGAVIVLGFAVLLWRTIARFPRVSQRIFLGAFLGASWFIAWKHGFTRGDRMHLPMFFLYTLFLSILLPGFFPEKKNAWIATGCILLCLLGLDLNDPQVFGDNFRAAPRRWVSNAAGLWAAGKMPSKWQAEFEAASREASFPELKSDVGSATIDGYNFNQTELLLDGLNYTPRPVFQSYSAYTPWLTARNREFFDRSSSPEFIFWQQETIDQRFPTQDDAELFAFLPSHYEVFRARSNYVLLRKSAGLRMGTPSRESILKKVVNPGEKVEIPLADRDRVLWVKLQAQPSLLGKLRMAVYKPAPLWMTTLDPVGGREYWRVLPKVIAAGVLLHPILKTSTEFAAYMKGGPTDPPLLGISIEILPGDLKYWSTLELEIEAEVRPQPATALYAR